MDYTKPNRALARFHTNPLPFIAAAIVVSIILAVLGTNYFAPSNFGSL